MKKYHSVLVCACHGRAGWQAVAVILMLDARCAPVPNIPSILSMALIGVSLHNARYLHFVHLKHGAYFTHQCVSLGLVLLGVEASRFNLLLSHRDCL